MDFPVSEPEFGVTDAVRADLPKISPAAIDRKPREEKKRLYPHGISGTKPGSLIRGQAQVRTHYPFSERESGFSGTDIADTIPFPLKGIDSDNGGEFINKYLVARHGRRDAEFTRSRPTGKTITAMWGTKQRGALFCLPLCRVSLPRKEGWISWGRCGGLPPHGG
jgi:hypothetical protein